MIQCFRVWLVMIPCTVMSCHVMSCHVMSCHVMLCHVMSCHAMPYNDQAYAHLGLVLSLSVCIVPDTWNGQFEIILLLTRPVRRSLSKHHGQLLLQQRNRTTIDQGLRGDSHILLQELWMASAIPRQTGRCDFRKTVNLYSAACCIFQRATASSDISRAMSRSKRLCFIFSGTYVYGTCSTAPKQCHMMYTYICIKCDKRV